MSDAAIDLWLDDVRPAPLGWLHVRTDAEAREVLMSRPVRRASLDHDLGACAACLDGRDAATWLQEHGFKAMLHCEHFGTGYTLVCWMEETGRWPQEKPTVHSANPVGRAKMLVAIERRFGR